MNLKQKPLEIDSPNEIWTKVIKSQIQNIKLLLTITWSFQKCGLPVCYSLKSTFRQISEMDKSNQV